MTIQRPLTRWNPVAHLQIATAEPARHHVEAGAERDGSASLSKDDYGELKRLRAEVTELRMERDVPKRSVVLWVKEATK